MTTFPDRMGSDGISGGMGDASGPGSSQVEPQAGLDASHSIPIAYAWFQHALAKRVYEGVRGMAAANGRYSGMTWDRASEPAKAEAKAVTRMVLDCIRAMGCTVVSEEFAQGIEARRAETQRGSVVDESPLPEGNAP